MLARPVDGGSLALFRIAVGLVMTLEAWSLFRPSASTSGRVMLDTYYTGPDITFSFPYPGFEWLPLLPGPWIRALVVLMGLGGLSLAIGFKQRLSAAIVFLSWGYLYAVESTRTYWMSYYYLELLVVFLLIWMPAARRYSLDAAMTRPRLPTSVPCWTVFLLRAQLVITYFYAGVAKCNADWLLDGEPVRYYLQKAAILPKLEAALEPARFAFLKGILQSEAVVWFLSSAGAAFDLSVGFLLLIPRTRLLGFVLLVAFHTINHFILFADIIWFPLVGVTTALIFFDPDWPARLRQWLSRPRLRKPDWSWLVAGGFLVPILGVALGWRAHTSASPAPASATSVTRPTFIFVCAWLTWQILFPLRGALIPGDARVTFEGLSFSWRLKAEVYRSAPCTIFIDDPAILSRDASGQTRIDWNPWKSDRVLYRSITPGRVDWSRLPEVFVLYERTIGERILYNPLAGSAAPKPEAECRERISRIWQELYGRQPGNVLRTVSLEDLHAATMQVLRRRGVPADPQDEARNLVESLEGRRDPGVMRPLLRQVTPFATRGVPAPPAPLFLIQDAALEGSSTPVRIDRSAWQVGPATRFPSRREPEQSPAEALVVMIATPETESQVSLPQAFLLDSFDAPDQPPRIVWSYLQDLPVSKAMHVSTQPFLLRRYARRVADWWQSTHGRRPAVRATTSLSLNFRPPQATVEPEADLASVPLAWLRHNPWIRDLDTRRIPREGIHGARPFEGGSSTQP